MSRETPLVEQSHCVITTLIAYCRLALFERQVQKEKALCWRQFTHQSQIQVAAPDKMSAYRSSSLW